MMIIFSLQYIMIGMKQTNMHYEMKAGIWKSCVESESFVREGPTLTAFF